MRRWLPTVTWPAVVLVIWKTGRSLQRMEDKLDSAFCQLSGAADRVKLNADTLSKLRDDFVKHLGDDERNFGNLGDRLRETSNRQIEATSSLAIVKDALLRVLTGVAGK